MLTEKSADHHVRKKRIIDRTSCGNLPVEIENVPYIVIVKQHGNPTCAGSILAPNIIITSAHCVADHHTTYSILSGTSCANGAGKPHNVIRKIIHPDYQPKTFTDDLALLIIFPPIDLESFPNRKIDVNEGPVLTNTNATVSGWGCIDITP